MKAHKARAHTDDDRAMRARARDTLYINYNKMPRQIEQHANRRDWAHNADSPNNIYKVYTYTYARSIHSREPRVSACVV